MSQTLVDPSPDIVRLAQEGYEVEIRGTHLLVSHVPYVNSARTVCYGTLVSPLTLNGNVVGKPENHVVRFAGEHPCHRDGRIMNEIQHASENATLAEGIVVNHSFSNKPASGYADYYEKMGRYVEILWAPARAIDPTCTPKTHRVVEAKPHESIFHYLDTNSSRAGVEAIGSKFKGQRIAIVGLGGTGSYVLDLVAKTPVAEVHLFDGDLFAQHNAFRAPGAPSVNQLKEPPLKVSYLAEIYGRMRRGIVAHAVYLEPSNLTLLKNFDFVFICVDKGTVKREIITFLEAEGISCIDVGMGVHLGDGCLLATVRVTTSTTSNRDCFRKNVSFTDPLDDAYSSNIQIADLNMLNAALAVVRWKKLAGFYLDIDKEHQTTYCTNLHQLLSE